jgi:hypothetical protein
MIVYDKRGKKVLEKVFENGSEVKQMEPIPSRRKRVAK